MLTLVSVGTAAIDTGTTKVGAIIDKLSGTTKVVLP